MSSSCLICFTPKSVLQSPVLFACSTRCVTSQTVSIYVYWCFWSNYFLVYVPGCTPLHWAAIRGNLEACTVLVQAGDLEDLLAKESTGCTPFQLASDKGHRHVAFFLVRPQFHPLFLVLLLDVVFTLWVDVVSVVMLAKHTLIVLTCSQINVTMTLFCRLPLGV